MPFEINLCSEVIRTLGFRAQCAFARSVGYEGLEVAPFTLGPEPHRREPPTTSAGGQFSCPRTTKETLPIGRCGDESTMFQLAAQIERAAPWAGRRPSMPLP